MAAVIPGAGAAVPAAVKLGMLSTVWSLATTYPWVSSMTTLFGVGIISETMPEAISQTGAKVTQFVTQKAADTFVAGTTAAVEHVGVPLLERGIELTIKTGVTAVATAVQTAGKTVWEGAKMAAENPETVTKPIFGKAPPNTIGLDQYIAAKFVEYSPISAATLALGIVTVITIGAAAYTVYNKRQAAVQRTADNILQTVHTPLPKKSK